MPEKNGRSSTLSSGGQDGRSWSPAIGTRDRPRTREIDVPAIGLEWPREPRVLVVASYPAYADGLTQLLRTEDRQVEVASSGIEALQLAGRSQPDIVLCDLELRGAPTAHGLARALRADPCFHDVYLVGLTVKALAGCEAEALRSGFDEVLQKSGDIEPIEELIRKRRAPGL
jgi:CheY-like chemotaxis protein